MSKKYKICMLSDSPFTPTGYSKISTEVLNRLDGEKWEKHHFSHNFLGMTVLPGIKTDEGTVINKDFTIHGAGLAPYFSDKVSSKIKEIRPEVFGVLLDTFMLKQSGYDNIDLSPAKTFFYFPTDGGGGLPIGCETILKKVDLPIAMSKFGQKQVLDYHGIKSEYIPHGVDTKFFRPLFDDEKRFLKEKYGLGKKFVFLAVFRNQGRKMADRQYKALYAFSKFAKGKDDVVLLCHADPNDPASPFNTVHVLNRLGLQNKVCFTGMTFFKGFDTSRMNEVYNLGDVYVSSTSGEGWGICTIEAMSAGLPCIITDYTTTREIIYEDGVCVIPVPLTGCPSLNLFEMNSYEYDMEV